MHTSKNTANSSIGEGESAATKNTAGNTSLAQKRLQWSHAGRGSHHEHNREYDDQRSEREGQGSAIERRPQVGAARSGSYAGGRIIQSSRYEASTQEG